MNLNKLFKEYDGSSSQKVLNDEIKLLEIENMKLKERIKIVAESSPEIVVNPNSSFNESNFSDKFSASFQFQSSSTTNVVNNAFDTFFSPAQQQANFGIDDPFQAFDPFKDSSVNDPFKVAAPIGIDKSVDFSADDPFASPFDQIKNNSFNDSSIQADDPFSVILFKINFFFFIISIF